MTRDEALASAKDQFAADQTSVLDKALGGMWDAAVAAQPPVVGADADEQAKIDAAVAQAVGPLNDQIASLQAKLDSIPADTTPFDQAAVDAAAAKSAADQKAADDAILASAKADMQSVIDGLNLKLKENDKDAILEALADKIAAVAQEVRDATIPMPAPAPVEPAPVEPAPAEPAQA